MSLKLTITSLPDDEGDAAEVVRRIAELMDEGYTSGFEPYWSLDKEED